MKTIEINKMEIDLIGDSSETIPRLTIRRLVNSAVVYDHRRNAPEKLLAAASRIDPLNAPKHASHLHHSSAIAPQATLRS